MSGHRFLRSSLAALAITALVGACGDDDDAVGFDDFEVFTDDADPIAVEQGASFFIELESNITTGYRWVVVEEPDPAVARVVTQDYVPDETEEDVVGSGGIDRLEIEAVGEGSTVLTLEYQPPGADGEPAETAAFTIDVE